MVVCLCQGVSEKRVRAAIAAGAHSRKQVTKSCGAGAGCGGCHAAIRDLIREHQAEAARAEAPEAPVLAPPMPAAVCA
jgi:bacterioferritin-associated ferredoxin